MTQRKPLVIGPFAGGLNLFDDPTSIRDTEVVEALNFEPGLDGSLVSRPPFQDLGNPLPLGIDGSPTPVGVFYAENGSYYLIASDGLSSTWQYFGGTWTLITNTFAASAMSQFDGKAWLVSPVGGSPGGYWEPVGGFVADSAMPHGDAIIAYQFRLWIARGKNAAQGTRIYYSKALGQPSFWASPGFIDVGAGDGQSVVQLATYYNSLVVFRTRSIYTIQYATDPALATVQVLVPGVGLENKYCLVSDENYLYFFYDGNAYQFINNQVQQINVKVPFAAVNRANIALPLAVSVFGKRVLFSFYDTVYVFSLRTRTWTRWRSPQFGSIGKIVSPVSPTTQDAAYALSSALIPPVGQVRTNLCKNPNFGTDAAGWNTSTGISSIVRSTGTTLHGHGFFGTATVNSTNGFAQVRYSLDPLGEQIPAGAPSLSVNMEMCAPPGKTLRGVIMFAFYDAAGAVVGNSLQAGYVDVDDSKWTRLYYPNIAVPAGATRWKAWAKVNNAEPGSKFYVDSLCVEVGPTGTKPTYFDGGYVDTTTHRYDWTGTANASTSTQTYILRSCPLLFIRDDGGTVEELFDCVLQTKNYNFELPSNFKRLFWWGVDAIFKGEVKGQAIPINYAQKPTWGQLIQQKTTWKTMLKGTWGSPLSVPLEIITSYDAENLGSSRKFAKFHKGLRFRQIGFRVTFPVDGTILTMPVYIFSITAHVVTRETVVKAIS